MSEGVMENRTTWLDQPVSTVLRLDWEKALYVLILVLAVLSRLWDLGARAISHDESLHAYYAWELYRGQGFQHTPLMHGTFLFHLNALIYALFGVDDFTARIAPAVFGVALVMSPILLRRWLGRRGALVTSFLILISPSILYHARYIRNESYMLLFGMLMVWAMLSYVRDRAPKWLYLLAALTALMYVTKEVSFIYIAIFGAFAVALAVVEMARDAGGGRSGVAGALLAIGLAVGLMVVGMLIGARVLDAFRPAVPADGAAVPLSQLLPSLAFIVLAGLLIGGGVAYVLRALMPDAARRSAGFDIAVILGGLSMFMLSAAALLVVNHQVGLQYQEVNGVRQAIPDTGSTIWGILSGAANAPYVDPNFFKDGHFPIDPTNTVNVLRLAFLVMCFAALAIGLGVWWDAHKWLIALGIFGGIGVTLFTTVFTNGIGLGTGFVGSLGYWLAQQEVQRGSQPPGYYFWVTSFYEYLPMILTLVGIGYIGWRLWIGRNTALNGDKSDRSAGLFVPLSVVWVVLSWVIYSWSGEKMPWLMTHLAPPMIVLSGRLVGEWFDRIDWRAVLARREWLAAILVPLCLGAAWAALGYLGAMITAAGQASAAPSLAQLNAAGGLLSGLLVGTAAFAGLVSLARRSGLQPLLRMAGLAALGAMTLMTIRTAWLYNYVNYDYVTEFGMYAHGGPGLKIALRQIEELSQRLTGTPREIEVLYDSEATWPWLWYLRDFPNKRYIASTPSRSDASLPVMILSDNNWSAVDQSVGSQYNWFQFHRIWWPMEDYKRIPEIVCPAQVRLPDGNFARYAAYDENGDAVIDPDEQRAGDARCRQHALDLIPAVWDIFFRRDYTRYAELTGQTFTAQNWPLRAEFRLYVRKDLAAKAWDQAVGDVTAVSGPAPGPSISDPYQARWQDVAAVKTIGSAGSAPGEFVSPHGIAIAPDGSIYIADSGNHRVVKFGADGQLDLHFGTWSGEPPNSDFLNPDWNPPGGTFYEPWDVAVGPDGMVYVADLWNSRIQKFDANGKFVTTWGGFGNSGQRAVGAEGRFYGPRGVAVGADGRVYVADTGNKRVQVFDRDGRFLTQFGGGGLLDGNLDEPVGIAVNGDGEIVVADTWNGRIQVFGPDGQALRKWEIFGWYDPAAPDFGQAKVGKPYLGVGPDGRIYIADQVANRILVFDRSGQYQASFGQFGSEGNGFSAPSGVAVDEQGNVLVVDTGNSRLMVFPPLVDGPAQ